MFSLTGYLGVNIVLNLVKIYGALIAVTGMASYYFFEIHFSSIVRLQTHQSSFWEMEVTEKAYAGSCC